MEAKQQWDREGDTCASLDARFRERNVIHACCTSFPGIETEKEMSEPARATPLHATGKILLAANAAC